MGRYPFLTYLDIYITENRPYKAKSTLAQEERTLKRMHKFLQLLKKEGKVSTSNPTKMTMNDVGAFLYYIRNRGIDNNTQVHYCHYMKNLLNWSGNPVMEKMVKRKLIPTENRNKPIETLTENEIAIILQDSQNYSGWKGEILALIIPMFYYTGLRSKELINADINDLNTVKWMLTVRHPKGEGTWGMKRTVPIPGPLRPCIERFLEAREKRQEEYSHIETTILIPNLTRFNATGKAYQNQSFLRWKCEVEESTGIKFNFRMLRRTHGQHLRDRDVPMDAISKLMGHTSTVTTEKYYARIRDEHAFQLAEEAWSQLPVLVNSQ